MMSRTNLHIRRGLVAPVSVAMLSLVACAANPGPPPIVDAEEVIDTGEETSSTSTSTAAGAEGLDSLENRVPSRASLHLAIGVDPVASGLNPHLVKDDSVFVRALADLVLPSAFEDGVLNRDLLESARVVDLPSDAKTLGIVQTVRYELDDEAQWSDGTPITVGDFEFLYKAMISTSGVVDAAPYRTIERIRSSNSGRTIEVDFNQAFYYWPVLFQHLLPSHLVSDFGSGLDNDIPASGSRYSFKNYDRQVGTLVVVRNDRFWGKTPASHDEITFREVRSASVATDLLRAGQIQALDITPTQTSQQAIALLGNNNLSFYNSGRQLQIVANNQLSQSQRAQLQEAIDPELLAELAFDRDNNIERPEPHEYTGAAPTSVASSSDTTLEDLGRAVRIGVDPSDAYAQRAARALVDSLAQRGITATLVTTDAQHLYGSVLRSGEVDAVVTWLDTPAVNLVECARPVGDADANSKVTANGANFAGICDDEVEQQVAMTLSGEITPQRFDTIAADINSIGHYSTVIALDTRLSVTSQNLSGVTAGLEDINSWTLQPQAAATETEAPQSGSTAEE